MLRHLKQQQTQKQIRTQLLLCSFFIVDKRTSLGEEKSCLRLREDLREAADGKSWLEGKRDVDCEERYNSIHRSKHMRLPHQSGDWDRDEEQ